MNSELIINSTKDGKAKQQTIRNINPDVANSVVGAFAEKCIAMSTENYSSANVVRKSDVSETGGATDKQQPILSLGDWEVEDTVYSAAITYDGDGTLSTNLGTINNNTLVVPDDDGNFFGKVTASEGTNYAAGNFFFQLFTDKDTTLNTMIKAMDSLVVWLPFDTSPTEDLCGNTWLVSGSPTVGTDNAVIGNALQITDAQYLWTSNSVSLYGKDFTVSCYARQTASDEALSIPVIFSLSPALDSGVGVTKCGISRADSTGFYAQAQVDSKYYNSGYDLPDIHTRRHIALVYFYAENNMHVFVDGVRWDIFSFSSAITRKNMYCFLGIQNIGYAYITFRGSIDEFQVYDGVALWTKDFTPPTAEEYAALRAAWNKTHS